jgi:hypothetical protein
VRLRVTDGQQLVPDDVDDTVTHQMRRQGWRPGIAPAPDEVEVDGFFDKTEHGNDVRVLETLQDADLDTDFYFLQMTGFDQLRSPTK